MREYDPYRIFMFVSAISALIVMIFWLAFVSPILTNIQARYAPDNNYFGELKKYTLNEDEGPATIGIIRKVLGKTDKVGRNSLDIKKIDTISNALNQEVVLQKESRYIVDSKTRRYSNENRDYFFTFPKNVEERDYKDILVQIYPGVNTSELNFSNEEGVFGMSVYVFKYRMEKMSLKEETSDIINKGVSTDFWGKIWVEPKTGFIIKDEANWTHYFDNEGAGERRAFESGKLWQQDEEVKRIVRLTQSKKAMYQIYEFWIPVYLILFALAFTFGFFLKETSGK